MKSSRVISCQMMMTRMMTMKVVFWWTVKT